MAEFRTGVVGANGVTFHYLEVGEGPTVLALHGFPDHARSYRHQMPALAEAGYRVVAPYLRGYAPTENPEGDYFGVPALAADAVALANALSAEPVVLVGHDWGAAAAHVAAAMSPQTFSKLITMAVPYGPAFTQSLVASPEQQRRSWYMFFFQLPFAEVAVGLDDFAFIERLWRDWSPGWDFPQGEMDSLKRTLGKPGVLTAALTYYRHTFNPPPNAPTLEEVTTPQQIQVPTLYLHGRDDGCIGAELAEGMDSFFDEGLEKVIVDGAGHFVHQEQPKEVNRLILEFLE
ncbi:MAG: alpha/beta hydrolase [Acidobacteriota bacterium]|nr:alpha/beta hydrolase [Acidobacteriota bacterium]